MHTLSTRAVRLVDHGGHRNTRCITFIGAGAAVAGVIARIAQNQAVLDPRPLLIHLVHPCLPGAEDDGHNAAAQPSVPAREVTLFPDESCQIAGPICSGPSVAQWAQLVRSGRISFDDIAPRGDVELARELQQLTPDSFPSATLLQRYLRWFLERSTEALGEGSRVLWHRGTVASVNDAADGAQIVELDSGEAMTTDLVIYDSESTGVRLRGETKYFADFADFAAASGAHVIVPGAMKQPVWEGGGKYPAPSEPMIVRGLGPAAISLIARLTEDLGGSFQRDVAGTLHYHPSGREPKLLLAALRGVPHHPQPTLPMRGQRYTPRFFTPEIAHAIAQSVSSLNFTRDLWPHIERELHYAHYQELFTGSPQRVRVAWPVFLAQLTSLDLHGSDYAQVLARAVPDARDRLHLSELDRPLVGTFPDRQTLQQEVRDHIRAGLTGRANPARAASAALLAAVIQCDEAAAEIAGCPKWEPESYFREFRRDWRSLVNHITVGISPQRLEQLVALSEGDIVSFLGPEVSVRCDPALGAFVASSPSIPDTENARVLADTCLPEADIRDVDSAALADLLASGAGRQERIGGQMSGRVAVRSSDSRVIRGGGGVHPRRYVIGANTSAPQAGSFGRVNANALVFRRWDAVARAILLRLAEIRDTVAAPAHNHLDGFDGAVYLHPDSTR